MRHLGSIVLSLIGVVLLPSLSAVGLAKVVAAGVDGGGSPDHSRLAIGLAYLAGAGVVLAALLVLRLSPVGLFVAGLLLAAGSMLVMFERQRVLAHLPSPLLGQTDVQWLAPAPFVFVISVPLLLSVFSMPRWRHRSRKQPVERVDSTEPLPVGGYVAPDSESWHPA